MEHKKCRKLLYYPIQYDKMMVLCMYEEMFSKRLAQLRMQKGVSARDMSLSLGQNHGYINSIENGKTFPTMTNFFYICEYLHITPKEFFEDGSADPETIRKMVENLKRLDGEQVDALSKIVEGLAK